MSRLTLNTQIYSAEGGIGVVTIGFVPVNDAPISNGTEGLLLASVGGEVVLDGTDADGDTLMSSLPASLTRPPGVKR